MITAPLLIAAALPASTGTLDLSIIGLRNTHGNVLVCLTANPRAFPDCSRDPLSHRMTVAANGAASLRFPDIAFGEYAVSLIHDENGNGKLDTRMMIPREGFGFSRNPVIVFGPPKFGAAEFAVGAGETAQTVRMKYMF